MNAATTNEAQKSVTNLETTTADVLSLKLYRLIEIVKLAAYATENGLPARECDTSEVLHYVADELHGVNSDFTETVHSLARVMKGGAQ